jgi:hypothetical protein
MIEAGDENDSGKVVGRIEILVSLCAELREKGPTVADPDYPCRIL